MGASAADIDCEQCECQIRHRMVTLELEYGGKHNFCSDSCEHRWMAAQLSRHRRFLNRILCTTRGRGRDIALLALRTNESP